MNSVFKFENFKIDDLELRMAKDLRMFEFNGTINPNLWDIQVSFRSPIYFKERKKYLGGLEVKMSLFPDGVDKASGNSRPILTVKAGIGGVFHVDGDKPFPPETEQNLVKFQIPVILFPYLRAAMGNLFASCGLGSVIFPLINVQNLAKGVSDQLEIQVVDEKNIPDNQDSEE